jgi:hypothetical protein
VERMRVLVISFDALEYDLVEKFQLNVLKQKYYGKVDLESYFQKRPKGVGGREPRTPEVYSIIYTGKIPENPPYEHFNEFLLEVSRKKHDTIFDHAKKPFGVDLVGYPPIATDYGSLGKSWVSRFTGRPLFSGYYRDIFTLEEAEEAYYSYMDCKTNVGKIVAKLDFDLVFLYYKEPDNLQHFYNNYDRDFARYKTLYHKCNNLAQKLIKAFDDGSTLIIILSDHGTNLRGGHSSYGFWSTNIDIGFRDSIPVEKWYNIIIQWLEHGPVFKIGSKERPVTDEEKKIIVERLKKLGYVI